MINLLNIIEYMKFNGNPIDTTNERYAQKDTSTTMYKDNDDCDCGDLGDCVCVDCNEGFDP